MKKNISIANKLLAAVLSLAIIIFIVSGIIINSKVSSIVNELVMKQIMSESKSIGSEVETFFCKKICYHSNHSEYRAYY